MAESELPGTDQHFQQQVADYNREMSKYLVTPSNSGNNTPLTPTPVDPTTLMESRSFNEFIKNKISGIEPITPKTLGWSTGVDLGDAESGFERYKHSRLFKKLGYLPGEDNEARYHDQQSSLARMGNSAANLVGKTFAYAVQNIGFLGGAPGSILTGDISNMTDNWLVKAGESIKEFTQEHNPIYKGDKYTKGNIWDKLASSDWWMDDAVDRVALTISMFLPGILQAKGLGLGGGVIDATGTYKGVGFLTKPLTKVAQMPPSEYGILGKTFLPKLYNAAVTGVVDMGTSPALKAYAQNLTRAELYTWNIVGQSALNGRETQVAIKRELRRQRDEEGKVISDDEIDKKAAIGARDSFWETVPVSLSSSLFEIPLMFSTARGARSMLNKLYNAKTAEAFTQVIKSSAPGVPKILAIAALTGFEHGQNESMQVAISRYNEDKAAGKDTRGTIPGIWGDFLDNVNDPNGQNNIALGTIQGVLMSLIGRGKDRLNHKNQYELLEKRSTFDLINQARMHWGIYNGDLALRHEDGQPVVVDKNGKITVIKDQNLIVRAGLNIAQVQAAVEAKKNAIAAKQYDVADAIDHQMLADFAYKFFPDNNGLEHLKGIMGIEKKAHESDPDWNAKDYDGTSMTPEDVYNRNMSTIHELKQAFDAIDQRHGGNTDLGILDLKETEIPVARQFLNIKHVAQYQEASNQLFLNKRLRANEARLGTLQGKISEFSNWKNDILDKNGNLVHEKIISPSEEAEVEYNEKIDEKKDLENALKISKLNYKKLIDKTQIKEAFQEYITQQRDITEKESKATADKTVSKTAEVKVEEKPLAKSTKFEEMPDEIKTLMTKHLDEMNKARKANTPPEPELTMEEFLDLPKAKEIIKNYNTDIENRSLVALRDNAIAAIYKTDKGKYTLPGLEDKVSWDTAKQAEEDIRKGALDTKLKLITKAPKKVIKVKDITYGYVQSLIDQLPTKAVTNFTVEEQAILNNPKYVKTVDGKLVNNLTPPTVAKTAAAGKVIFGHPTIGKTTFRRMGANIIDFDEDYKAELNNAIEEGIAKHKKKIEAFIKEKKSKGEIITPKDAYKILFAYKKDKDGKLLTDKDGKKTFEPGEWYESLLSIWAKAKDEAKRTGKGLFASHMGLIKLVSEDFDVVYNLSEKAFLSRIKAREAFQDRESKIVPTKEELEQREKSAKDWYRSLKSGMQSKRVTESGKLVTLEDDQYLADIIEFEPIKYEKPPLPKELQEIYDGPQLKLNDTETEYINPDDQNSVWERASTIFTTKYPHMTFKGNSRGPADRGTVLDKMSRIYFMGNISKEDLIAKTKQFLIDQGFTVSIPDSIYDDMFGILESLEAKLVKEGWTVLSDLPVLYGVINGQNIAGSVDFLLYKEVKGKRIYKILDLKTSTTNLIDIHEQREADNVDRILGYTFQQAIYMELLRQRTGVDQSNISASLLALLINKNQNKISWAKDKDGNKGTYIEIDKKKDIYDLLEVEKPAELNSKEAVKELEERIKKADLEELSKIEIEVASKIAENTIDAVSISKLIESRRKDLDTKFSFDTVKEGDILVTTEAMPFPTFSEHYIVEKKNKNAIKVIDWDPSSKLEGYSIMIKKEEFEKFFRGIYNPATNLTKSQQVDISFNDENTIAESNKIAENQSVPPVDIQTIYKDMLDGKIDDDINDIKPCD